MVLTDTPHFAELAEVAGPGELRLKGGRSLHDGFCSRCRGLVSRFSADEMPETK
jgi:hypothetical protein